MNIINANARLPLWSVAWEVDGASGSTFVRASSDDHARNLFRATVTPAWRIVSVRRGY